MKKILNKIYNNFRYKNYYSFLGMYYNNLTHNHLYNFPHSLYILSYKIHNMFLYTLNKFQVLYLHMTLYNSLVFYLPLKQMGH